MARQSKTPNTKETQNQSNSDFIEEFVSEVNKTETENIEKKTINVSKKQTIEVDKPLNLEEKITLKNIANWPIAFAREETAGDIVISANGFARLTRNEVILQVNKGNRLFTGAKLDGNHPTIFIDDEPTRIELGYDQQIVLTEQLVEKLMDISDFDTFVSQVNNNIVTRGEKYSFAKAVEEKGFNDYKKMMYLESYTGYHFNRFK